MSVKQNLTAAKQLIEDGGWVQQVYYDGRGCFCAVGAVKEIIGDLSFFGRDSTKQDEYDALIKAVEKVSGKEGNRHIDDVFMWNDTLGRTKEEVLEMFDEAIRIADE
jgi:hypothetical protein